MDTVFSVSAEAEIINFGDLPKPVDALLQQGVAAYRQDKSRADALFREALALAPHELPIYFCLYKIHTYQGHLEEAAAIAEAGLSEAARQCGWPDDWRAWRPQAGEIADPARFALYTLKALAFIRLRQSDAASTSAILAHLAGLDPAGVTGWPVVAALAEGAL